MACPSLCFHHISCIQIDFRRGWFEGLSDLFLSLPAAKLLLLAGTDRLDKPLMIGQMQGKFQLVVLPAVGHTVQVGEESDGVGGGRLTMP